jgi:hypothetical protein
MKYKLLIVVLFKYTISVGQNNEISIDSFLQLISKTSWEVVDEEYFKTTQLRVIVEFSKIRNKSCSFKGREQAFYKRNDGTMFLAPHSGDIFYIFMEGNKIIIHKPDEMFVGKVSIINNNEFTVDTFWEQKRIKMVYKKVDYTHYLSDQDD